MKYPTLFILMFVGLIFVPIPALERPAEAAFKLPSYANSGGNLEAEAQKKGKQFTNTAMMISGILAVLGLVAGAGVLVLKGGQDGKVVLLRAGGALIILSLVFAIAREFTK